MKEQLRLFIKIFACALAAVLLLSAVFIAVYPPAQSYWQKTFFNKPTDISHFELEVADVAGRPIVGGFIEAETTAGEPEAVALTPEQEQAERAAFNHEEMTLEIPRLNLKVYVYNGTDEETLKKGPGLFEVSNMPGEDDRNVCIAAHRDIYGAEFLYINTIVEGDLIYLTTKTHRYTYRHELTKIVHAYDWSIVDKVGYSCITLQSCDPVGTSKNRIIARGRLISAEAIA